MNSKLKLSTLAALALASAAAQASGPLYISDETGTLKPLVWNTANGPIPVYTDGGDAFTYDFDGVTPFITIERANEITAEAFTQWSQVPTSTFEATIQGTIESQLGVADVTSANIADFIGVENGLGFWVFYDTDGSIMEDFFGVSRNAVLGISSPEFSDGNGTIIESWTVMNGWAVNINDDGLPDVSDAIFRSNFEPLARGSQYAGVFTHEIGHAINLAHSQVNGSMVYNSYSYAPKHPGVPGCVAPLYSYHDFGADPADIADPASIETMYPFIDNAGVGGEEQASVNISDDMIGISNLYPTAQYLASTGSISGVLRLKDGVTEYSGINVIARNIANPLFDAVSAMTGDATQGMLGPDGEFTISGLTPGAQYQVYIEPILAGGYPTTPRMMISESEYRNSAESSNPLTDLACDAASLSVTAGATTPADISFNGFQDGVQFTPIVAAFLTSLSTDGSRAGGTASSGQLALIWDKSTGVEVLPVWLGSNTGAIDGLGQHMAVQVDPDGNGIKEPAIWSETAPLTYLGDLNGNSCGGSSASGSDSAVAWDIDNLAQAVVGMAYTDVDSDGNCQGPGDEIVPFIWDALNGMQTLDYDPSLPWTRAHAISGNGRVVLGNSNFQTAWAWIDGGPRIDVTALTGAFDVNAVNFDGSAVAVNSSDPVTFRNTGILLWDAIAGTDPSNFTNIDSLRYCVDVPYLDFFGNDVCETMTPQEVYDQVGVVPINVFGINNDATVVVGRGGSFFTGFFGAIWVKDIGWMEMTEFLHKQGVVEAAGTPIDNPLAISGEGDTIMGGLAGVQFSWLIDLEEVYVCKNGVSTATTFPDGVRTEVTTNGAQFGRCEYLN